MAGKRAVYIPKEELNNRFINYYTIKWVWKEKTKHSNKLNINDLYSTFFPTSNKKGNRTLYNKLLKCSIVDIEKKIKHLPNMTGLTIEYFSGKKEFRIPGLLRNDWEKYITLRSNRKRGAPKSNEQVNSEKKLMRR